jgi:acyl-coenzyme A thioesterase PaaI-like protein
MEPEPGSSFERHPALTGRTTQARALADELRRLIRLSVSAAPSAEETVALTAQLAAVADRLESHVPAVALPRYAPVDGDGKIDRSLIDDSMPFDIVVGAFNPLALPVTLAAEPPKALGHARFHVGYEGAPGCVHGGALAATFDIVLSAANAIAGAAGPTVRLSLRYRRPTLIDEEALFEGWVTEVTDRRVFSVGRIVQGGSVTVEAEGEFAIFSYEGVHRLAAGRRAADDGATSAPTA